MFEKYYNIFRNWFNSNIFDWLEVYLPKILGALLILVIGFLLAFLLYRFVIYIFKKFRIIELIDKLTMTSYFESDNSHSKKETKKLEEIKEKITNIEKFSDKIKIDQIVAKSFSYYVFLIFFRFAILAIGIKEVEEFLGEVLDYLPNLFIALVIGFFGIRFANSVYNIVYYTLKITNDKTSKVIANGAKIIILFFTLMAVLAKAGIAVFIINTILIGFVSMVAFAGGLAFGLGGKDLAKEILESFKK